MLYVTPYFAYILKSQSTSRYYCGSTDDVERRLRQHNDPQYRLSKTTKNFPGSWKIVLSEQFETRSQAMTREKQIKKRGIRRFLPIALSR
ncbi:MAG: GIY-YIG nuclease family protein [Candidatus Lindowbacteria bacterium]|nr:GIY-YIG nuclease family protein [Candidatus Lindowbacteria bacterium]